MAEWISFLHAPRDDFAETMTDEEGEVWGRHDGVLVLAGPTLGRADS